MSLRAVGEGHISSIEFRTGVVDGELERDLRSARDRAWSRAIARRRPATTRLRFAPSSLELDAGNDVAWAILDPLPERFTLAELDASLSAFEREGAPHAIAYETVKIIRVLAASSYVTTFPADSALSERVIFPAGPHETHGMEDARFVRFTDDDGERDVLRDLHGVRRLRDHAAADPDQRLRRRSASRR